jgi:alpha-beta hydrolase superfamily lysophospholipase
VQSTYVERCGFLLPPIRSWRSAKSNDKQRGRKIMRFILIHGGFHAAWCWNRVIPESTTLGHEAVALDLPGHGERAAERPANYRGRIQPILDALQNFWKAQIPRSFILCAQDRAMPRSMSDEG